MNKARDDDDYIHTNTNALFTIHYACIIFRLGSPRKKKIRDYEFYVCAHFHSFAYTPWTQITLRLMRVYLKIFNNCKCKC